MNMKRSGAENFFDIIWYTWPELITAFVLHVMPRILESSFIGSLKSTSTYNTLGVSMMLIHLMVKVAEGLSIGTLVLVGQDNGVGRYEQAGKTLTHGFWIAVIAGAAISALIYFGTYGIFVFYEASDRMVELGVPYLRLRALSVFFIFVYFTFVGFLRGIKNTHAPMIIFSIGATIFVLLSYVLIFGLYGFPEMKLQGAAFAGVVQYGLMCTLALVYILYSPETRPYRITLMQPVAFENIKKLLRLSSPIMLDKATMAVVPIWLGKCFSPLGKVVLAAFLAIKDMERLVLLPANALAHVGTLLVSNHFGARDFSAIRRVIQRVLILLVVASLSSLTILLICRKPCICMFDHKNVFTEFSVTAFLILGPLMLFDSFQLVLSGFLRGAQRVKVVMVTRLIVIFCFFIPITYFIKQMPFESNLLKFLAIYGIFFMSTGIMAGVYGYYVKRRLKSEKETHGTDNT